MFIQFSSRLVTFRAQEFYKENRAAMFAGKLAGLLAVISIPSILKILVYTNQSSVPVTAYRRYIQTIFHMLNWYEHDLKPGTKSWKSLEAVRKRHVISSKYAEKGNHGFIQQKDMALTQFGFMGYITIRPDILGIPVSRDNYEAFVHFWRVMGYMLGIQDRFNVCTDSWQTTKPRLEIMLNEIYRPFLEKAPPVFDSMATALVDGLWCYNPMISAPSFVYYTKWMTNCSGYLYWETSLNALDGDVDQNRKVLESLDWLSRFLLFLQVTFHSYLVNFAVFRWYFNTQIVFATFLITYFPFLAFFKFGIKRSYVSILKGEK